MVSTLPERFEKFSSCFVDEFEMYIEVQRIIIEGETPTNANLSEIATNSISELFSSSGGMVGKTLSGVKDYVLHERKLDIAGKIINLVNKYQNPEEKKAIRVILVRVAFELFRSYELQFMNAEKSQGGWSQAMVQLARTAVWCFMHYYKFNPQEELNEQFLLEGITLKNMPHVRIWKKFYYTDEKNFTEETNAEDHMKYDVVKMYSKAGLMLFENQQPIYYKNDLTKPEKYGFRRIFSYESAEKIKTEYEVTKLPAPINYQYTLDMGTATKENMCIEILKKINRLDNVLLEDRLLENVKRITENIIENLICEMTQQIIASLKGIAVPAAATASTTNINNETTNSDLLFHSHTSEKIKGIHFSIFQGPIDMSFP